MSPHGISPIGRDPLDQIRGIDALRKALQLRQVALASAELTEGHTSNEPAPVGHPSSPSAGLSAQSRVSPASPDLPTTSGSVPARLAAAVDAVLPTPTLARSIDLDPSSPPGTLLPTGLGALDAPAGLDDPSGSQPEMPHAPAGRPERGRPVGRASEPVLNTRGLPMIPGRLALVSEAATLPNLDVLDGQGAQLAPGRLVPPLDSAPTGSVSLPQSGSALFQALPAVVPGRVGLAPTHRLIPRPVDSLPRTSGGTAQPESIPNTGNLSGEVSSVLGGSATLPPLIAIETMVPRLLTEDRALAERVSLRSGELPLESDEPPAARQALPERAAQSPDAETDLIDIALSLTRETAQTSPSGTSAMLGAVPSWSELGRLIGTVIPKSWRTSAEEFEEPPASQPRRKHDDAHSSMQQGEPPDERASTGDRRDTAAGRDRADSGLSARQLQGRPRRTFHRICEPGDAGLPEGYLTAVAWLLTRQAESLSEMAFRGELLQLDGGVDLDAAAAEQYVRSSQIEVAQASRIRRLSAELDPALDAHVMAHRGVLALSRSRERALSWPVLLVRSLLLHRHSASLAYEWINSSYLPCRRDAEPVWRLAISEAQHTFCLLRTLCQRLEGHALAWEALGGCRSEISELFPTTQPEWQSQLIRWGLRRRFDSEMRDEYAAELVALLGSIGLCFPGFDPESKGS